MQYENKILVSAILIIGVALISFNVVNPNISGRSITDKCIPFEVRATKTSPAVVTVEITTSKGIPNTNYQFPDYGKQINLYTDQREDIRWPSEVRRGGWEDEGYVKFDIRTFGEHGSVVIYDKCGIGHRRDF